MTRALKSGSVSSNDVNRGKALLKAAILESYSTDSSLINEIGVQAVHLKQVQSIDSLLSAVDSVTQQEVQEVFILDDIFDELIKYKTFNYRPPRKLAHLNCPLRLLVT